VYYLFRVDYMNEVPQCWGCPAHELIGERSELDVSTTALLTRHPYVKPAGRTLEIFLMDYSKTNLAFETQENI